MICHSTSSQILTSVAVMSFLFPVMSSYLLPILFPYPHLVFIKAAPKSPMAPLVNHYEGLIQTDILYKELSLTISIHRPLATQIVQFFTILCINNQGYK